MAVVMGTEIVKGVLVDWFKLQSCLLFVRFYAEFSSCSCDKFANFY